MPDPLGSVIPPGMMPARRVVVTGAGAVTPLGIGVEPFWAAVKRGESGVRTVTRVNPDDFPTKIAAEVPGFEAGDWMDKKDARRSDPFIHFAAAAARQALDDCGIVFDDELRDLTGVLIGTGIGGLTLMGEQTRILRERGPDRVSPFWVAYMIGDMASGYVSIVNDLRGPNHCVTSACSTGANAIGDAYQIIRRGDMEVMLAGGTEAAINEIGMAGFCANRAMSTRNDEPERASCPWDRRRDGFVMGEGAAVMVLEERERALARGAKIYGEVVGYGMSADAYHLTAPHPEGRGAAAAMRMALRTAGLAPEAIEYANAHGTSTPIGDPMEVAAMKRVFGDHAYRMAVSSTKSMHGHTLGAAGAIESLVCLLAMRDEVLPPTTNLEEPDDGCDLDFVPNVARPARVSTVLNNSFGFGGHNVSLIMRRHSA